jgi:hypothetical protein
MTKNKKLQDKLETICIGLLALTLMAGYVWNILIRIV